ncbi:hypothetical protein ACFQ4A_02620 [Lentibacillus salinarum]|uniref:Uncharacterized protein n=2 Tax=Lentibacillus salinarum TaxID=446820 RepID=A0ABW3ZRZ0_9BACI
MAKSKLRTILSCWLLLLILFSGFDVTIEHMQLSVSFLVLLAGALVLHARLAVIVFHVFCSITIMIGYTGVLIWESFTPLKLFLPPFLTISCILFVLVMITTTGLWNRLACSLLGMSGGELLYSIIMSGYSIAAPIGDKRFLDFILVITMALLSHDLLRTLNMKIIRKLQQSIPGPKPLFRKKAQ